MPNQSKFWKFLDRVGIGWGSLDLLWKLITFVPVIIVGIGSYIQQIPWPVFVPLALVALAASIVVVRLLRAGHVGANADREDDNRPSYTAPDGRTRPVASRLELLTEKTFKGMALRISDVPRQPPDGPWVVGYTFEDCIIVGPAIVMVGDQALIVGCTWGVENNDPNTIMWSVPKNSTRIGAIGLRNVLMKDCYLKGIGVASDRGTLKEMQEQSFVNSDQFKRR